MTHRIFIIALSILFASAGPLPATEKESAMENASSKTEGKAKSREVLPYCPICGPEEDSHDMTLGYRYKGIKYKFCSMSCLRAFKADPEKFLSEDYEADGHVEEGVKEHEGDSHDGHDH